MLPCALQWFLCASSSPPPASSAPTTPPVKDEALDKAVDHALAFLQSTQLTDGSWTSGGKGAGQANPAVTSLCVMAFLSAGHVPGEGRYGETVEKGIRWVLQAQQDNGLIANNGGQEMYHHGISTLMLAEAAGMTDGKLGEEIRKKLVKAVDVILRAQRTEDGPERGGWRYTVAHTDSDMSVTGWQVMALRAAKNVGCDVPAQNIDEAVAFVKRCQDPHSGGFDYMPNANVTVACTGTGILALEICGKDLHHGSGGHQGRQLPHQEPAALRRAVRLLRSLLLLAGDVPARRQLLGLLPPRPARHAVQEPEGKRLLGRRRRRRRLRPQLHHRHVRSRSDGGVSLPADLSAR